MNYRVIARLDIKGPNLVKGIHLEGLRVLGKPEDFARHYYKAGADELIYIDVVASLYNRNSLHEIISKTAKEIFIPLTVGGGIRNIQDIKEVLRAGADKVSLNTAAVKNPRLISDASNIFGSSTLTISVEAIRQSNGSYLAYTDNGREYTGVEVISWVKEVERLGAGEILLTSIDREGTGLGFDIELISLVSKVISIPLVASGGAGKKDDVVNAIQSGADAVSLASLIHYDFIYKNKKKSEFNEEGNIDFLKSGKTFSGIEATSIKDIKKYLLTKGLKCRY